MAEFLRRARVQLLDEFTGEPIEDVDVLTSTRSITYTNEKPIPKAFGELPDGTTFDQTNLDVILENLLYPYFAPELICIEVPNCFYCEEPSILKVIKPETVYIETGEKINNFNVNCVFKSGSKENIIAKCNVYDLNKKTTSQEKIEMKVEPGKDYSIKFPIIRDIKDDVEIYVTLTDCRTELVSEKVLFDFVNPVYVGFAPKQLLNTAGELIVEDAAIMMNTLVMNNSYLLSKNIIGKKNLNAVYNSDILTGTYNPCILVPEEWGDILDITFNSADIMDDYVSCKLELRLDKSAGYCKCNCGCGTSGDKIYAPYVLYVSKSSYEPKNESLKNILYKFTIDDKDSKPIGTTLLTGFDLLANVAIDSRYITETVNDMNNMQYKYEGLVTYCKDTKTYYQWDGIEWVTTNNKTHVLTTVPDINTGSVGDIALSLTEGKVYKKTGPYNWEDLGSIIGTGEKGEKGDPGEKGEKGDPGEPGKDGVNGKSAYELAVEKGYTGTLDEWLEALKGEKGEKGDPGEPGKDGADGKDGVDGKSVYELAVESGFEGTLEEWVATIRGPKGDPGEPGKDGVDGKDGADGKSVFELAVESGFEGTLEEWIATIRGPKGDTGEQGIQGEKGEKGDPGKDGADGKDGVDGKSAYELAVEKGYTGTLDEWLEALKGEDGISATIEIGNVTTGDTVSVTNVGTESAAILDFVFPKGTIATSDGSVITIDGETKANIVLGLKSVK